MQGGRLIALGHLAVVAGFELLEQVAGIVVAAVHQGGDIVGQLEGGELVASAKAASTNAVFVCFAPYDDPQIALCLVAEGYPK